MSDKGSTTETAIPPTAAPVPSAPPPDQAQPGEEIAELGTNRVFVRKDERGDLECIRARVRLFEKLGQLYYVNGKVAVTALGYWHLNSIASLNLVTPTPPILEMDKITGQLKTVTVRKLAFGIAPATGNLVVSDATLKLDLRSYLLHEISTMVRDKPATGVICREEAVPEIEKEHKREGWGWYIPIEIPIGIWLDLKNVDVQKAIQSHLQRLKFAERIASTIASRNAFRSHPSMMGVTFVNAIGARDLREALVTVFGYKHRATQAQMEKVASQIVAGRLDPTSPEVRALTGRAEAKVEIVQEETHLGGPEDSAKQGIDLDKEAQQLGEPESLEAEVVASETRAAADPQAQVQEQLLPFATTNGPATTEAIEEDATQREQLTGELRLAESALANPKRLAELKIDAKVTDPRTAPLENLRTLLAAISKEVDIEAAAPRVQRPKGSASKP